MRSMNYNQARAKYWKKKIENPLPPLPEDERIYLNVPYMASVLITTMDRAYKKRAGVFPALYFFQL